MTLYYKGTIVAPEHYGRGFKDLTRLVGYCSCGKRLIRGEALPQVDPYDSDINDYYDLIVLCPKCEEFLGEEI